MLTTEPIMTEEENHPVLRISTSGKILYANKEAFELLKRLNYSGRERLPEGIIRSNKNILNLAADEDIIIRTPDYSVEFSAVGFSEGGYISLDGRNVVPANTTMEVESAHD